MTSETVNRRLLLLAVLLAVSAAYANHFHNGFHFDDFHTVTGNPAIVSLANFQRFFTDVTTSSNLPQNRAWRPLVTASLAFDYWLGKGLNPVAFHAGTFLLFLLQIAVMFWLFERLCNLARPDPANRLIAAFAAACYGLHPAGAETINYVAQRAELYSTLGVVAALAIYAARPEWRRYGVYLLPFAAAQLSKPPAIVFPVLLLAYALLFEKRRWRDALLAAVPALVVALAIAWLQARMTPATFAPGAFSPAAYRWTQPFVTLRYFRSFFLPLWLSADTDLKPLADAFSMEAIAGYVFVIAVLGGIVIAARRREWVPIAFGLIWFVVALIPTSIYALAEVENDHRMFFPFVGLVLAAVWAAALLFRRVPRPAVMPAALLLLAAAGYGVTRRNAVWRDETSLWRDVTEKSPRNGRGWMNYGLTRMSAGATEDALACFRTAQQLTPNYHFLEINLGIALGVLGRNSEAESHFRRAVELAPQDAIPHYYFARWLDGQGRVQEAFAHAQAALALNPSDPLAGNLAVSLAGRQPQAVAPTPPAAVRYLEQSLQMHQAGRYRECIRLAREALKLKPDYAEAYNNIAAGHEALGEWDEAIAAAREALRIKPEFALARNNLNWSLQQKALQAKPAK